MRPEIESLVEHDLSDDCPVCRAQEIVGLALMPAAAAWEQAHSLPRYSIALHGAAELLGAIIEEGISREDVDEALGQLLDDIERRIDEDRAMGAHRRAVPRAISKPIGAHWFNRLG